MYDLAPPRPPASIGKLVFGVILALLGILYTLDNFGLVEIGHIERLWPIILIAIGGSHLAQSWKTRPFSGLDRKSVV